MTELRQRQPRVECPGYLIYLRKRVCCVCGAAPPVEAAHIRMGNLARGKEPTGMQQKPDDKWAVPLCYGCHRTDNDAQHAGSEEGFWKSRHRDPFIIAEVHFAAYLAEGGKPPPEFAPRKSRKPKKARPKPKTNWPKGRKIPKRHKETK